MASPAQNCCGMPALDGGDVAFAQKLARANVASMLPLVRQGYRIAAINPTCSLMMRAEYPELLDTAEGRELAAAVVDPHELLYALRREGKFNRDFRTTPGKVAYHVPCHLKAQNVGLRSRDLIRIDPGRGGRDGGRLHGSRRHLGDEEGVFRAVDEVGRRRPSPE